MMRWRLLIIVAAIGCGTALAGRAEMRHGLRDTENALPLIDTRREAGAFPLSPGLRGSRDSVRRAQAPDRSKPPALGPPPTLTLPDIHKTTLGNGIPVWVIERDRVPLVQINVILRGGASLDRAGRFGMASMVAAMLDEGAGTRDALELADAIDDLGAEMATGSSFDYSAIRLSTPVRTLDQALPLLADVVLRPTFPESELDRLGKERLTALLQAQDNPAAIVQAAFPRVVFGPAHRYGTPAGGLAPAIESMTAADLRAFYEEHYSAGQAAIVVVGAVETGAITRALEQAFGGWPGGEARAASAAIPAAPPLKAREIVLVDKPGAAQSQIRIGQVGVPRSTADYATFEVLNTILGGSFTSRLNQNLRERNGFAYGAGSTFDMRASAGPFFAAAGVQTDKTSDALREFFVELNAIREPVSEEELDKARNYVALRFPAGFETSRSLAQKLEELIVYDLPDDTFETFVGKVTKVTSADVQRVANAHIQPERMAVVVVGDRAVIEPGIAALGLGPMRVVPIAEFFK